MCQGACRKTVGRATCMCLCVCTTFTGKQSSCKTVPAGAATPPFGLAAVSQPMSNCEFANLPLRINLGDSGGDNDSKGKSNDSRKGTFSYAYSSDVTWSVSDLILFLTSAITILLFILHHHIAWLPVSSGINEQKSGKYFPVFGRSEYAFFFGTCVMNC